MFTELISGDVRSVGVWEHVGMLTHVGTFHSSIRSSSIVQIWILPNGWFLLSSNSASNCCPMYVTYAFTLSRRHVLQIGFPAAAGDRWTCSSMESCLTSLFIFKNFNHLWSGCVSERYGLPSEPEGGLPILTPIPVFFRQGFREKHSVELRLIFFLFSPPLSLSSLKHCKLAWMRSACLSTVTHLLIRLLPN